MSADSQINARIDGVDQACSSGLQCSYHGIAARLDRLPISDMQKKMLFLLGGVVFCDSIDMNIGGPVIAQLLASGWSDSGLNALFVSTTMAGYFFGSLLAGTIADALGRRKSILFLTALFCGGCFVGAFAPDMCFLIVCRFVMGLGLGGAYPAAYSALSEFTPPKVRGKWQAYVGLLANSGTPVAAFISMVLLPIVGWRAVFIFAGILALIALILCVRYLDESPRWLASKQRFDEAGALLDRYEQRLIAKGVQIHPVADEIIEQAASKHEVKQLGWRFLFSKKMLGRTLTGVALMFAMNVCVYTVVTWTPTIFVSRGFDVTYSVAMTAVMQCGIPCGVFLMSLIVEKFKRKPFICVTLTIVGFAGLIWSQIPADQTVLIMVVGFLLCMCTYCWSVAASAVYLPEPFPTQCRTRGTGFCNAIGRIAGVISPYWIAFFIAQGNVTGVYLVSAGIAVAAVVITAIFGYETHGKTLEEINAGVL
ncbi:hypothetical protein JI75_06905 [Berryella intestinalis]|uniref:Major facilitator superfamily (MFS) profile domain-containing protein n=2 Tax=Berryella intestinalis TaxID=1531429 RepID=A0A0A8B4Z9_9ACTN|nr:hypothetical protein JI75_06905 [Berryella intestinalis]